MSGDPVLLAAVAAVFLLAGTVKGVIGLGLPTISVALLGMVLLPGKVAAILVLPAFLTNVWQVWSGPDLWGLTRRLSGLLAGLFLTTLVSARIVIAADPVLIAAFLGTVLTTYALFGLTRGRREVPRRREPWMSPLVGIATGIINGSTGIFMVPMSPYMQALEMDKDELVQSLGLGALAATSGLAAGLGLHGGFTGDLVPAIAIALAASFAGMALGRTVRDRLSLEVFRRSVLIGLLCFGIVMLIRAAIG